MIPDDIKISLSNLLEAIERNHLYESDEMIAELYAICCNASSHINAMEQETK